MTAKTYQAKSIQEAIGKIKAEMGADAMILSTQRLPKGPRNPYGTNIFEVAAAPPGVDVAAVKKPAFGESIGGGDHWLNRDSGDNAAAGEADMGWDEIRSELVTIKDMLFLFNQVGAMPDFVQMHPECLNLYARLVRAGISEQRARGFMKNAGAFSGRTSTREIAKNVLREILSKIEILDPFAEESGGRRVAAFIGPTGVGKTTTIAKLAAELSLKQKKRVGIISIDSYRIGAVEQLKTYSDIMGLPCLPAFSAEDFQLALSRMERREIILVDTAGQSHLDMDRMRELGRLMAGGDSKISNHLVLSATVKREDMREAAENFATLSPETYVFTKVDETRTRGGLIDQLMDLKLPVSFVTNGQRVPEDIMSATKKRILQLVLGDSQ
ncbi:MAG: flagellar biosynthesis protein FlhF [Desulfobacterales bacterium]|jgi:flagellar biosynthesis protein FlhF|nr:flagellar biosynthesis protein FlhF [Desulfobacterales bacterium]